MAGSLYESSFTLLMIFFIAICVAKLRFVEPSWTPPQLPPPPYNAAGVDCHCEQTPPPPVASITCPPPMPPPPPESFPYPEASSPPPPPDLYYPPTEGFFPPTIVYSSPPPPPTIVYSSPPPPYISSETPCDIPSPPQQCPWNEYDHPLPGFQFASAKILVKSAFHIASLVTVIALFFIGENQFF